MDVVWKIRQVQTVLSVNATMVLQANGVIQLLLRVIYSFSFHFKLLYYIRFQRLNALVGVRMVVHVNKQVQIRTHANVHQNILAVNVKQIY